MLEVLNPCTSNTTIGIAQLSHQVLSFPEGKSCRQVVVVSLFQGGPIKEMTILNTCDLCTYTLWSPQPSKPLHSAHLNYYYILTKKQGRREDQMGTDPSPDIVPQKFDKKGTDHFMILDSWERSQKDFLAFMTFCCQMPPFGQDHEQHHFQTQMSAKCRSLVPHISWEYLTSKSTTTLCLKIKPKKDL